MKKFILFITSILLCLLLVGCTAQIEDNTISTAPTTAAASAQAESAVTDKQSSDDNKSSTKQQNSTEKKEEKSSTKTSTTTTAINNTTTVRHSTKPAAPAESSAAKKQTTSTTSSSVTCTVTIECKSVLDNMDKLKQGHEQFVPSSGIMLENCSVTVKNGTSAYDAVRQACSNNSITINAVTSSYGIYIAGFNNIDEKDCGGGSGWLFFINGSMPNKSCGKYTVKNGDSIVFSYTC